MVAAAAAAVVVVVVAIMTLVAEIVDKLIHYNKLNVKGKILDSDYKNNYKTV